MIKRPFVNQNLLSHPLSIILAIAGAQVSQWTASCLENCIKKLTGLNKPFKYVVTCVIMQKNGEGQGSRGVYRCGVRSCA